MAFLAGPYTHDVLGDRLAAVAELAADDLTALLNIIDELVAKNSLEILADGLV